MKLRHGASARYNLTDGHTLEGTLAYSFGWWSYRLVEVTFYDPRTGEPVQAAGEVIVMKRSITFIQVGD